MGLVYHLQGSIHCEAMAQLSVYEYIDIQVLTCGHKLCLVTEVMGSVLQSVPSKKCSTLKDVVPS